MPSGAERRAGVRRGLLEEFLSSEAAGGSWPGAVWRVEERGRLVSEGAVGLRASVPDPSPATRDTVYDLASLTKPLATAALAALLESEGRLDLESPASALLPGLACEDGGRPTVLDLALHRSGLPAWRPFYARARGRDEVVDEVIRLAPEAPCGTRVRYSDPGYILLGEILTRATGRGLDALFRERIADRLGLGTVMFRPPPELGDRIAPTEAGNRHERALAQGYVDVIDAVGFREGLIAGEVHDGNAHAMGGVAGHAGLFGVASEVAVLAREFLGPAGGGTDLFGPRALSLFRENLTPGLEEGRTLGWKRAVAGAREAEGVLPPEAFGHAGFTGTSVWIDPSAGRTYVLLTNRVHPDVRPIDMSLLRRRFHEIASRIH